MKRVFTIIGTLLCAISIAGCGSSEVSSTQSSLQEVEITESAEHETQESGISKTEELSDNDSKVLVAYFSRAGENYNVGTVEKGNTQIMAEMIAEETGGTLFKIETVNPYPVAYDECTEVAKEEQNDNARPELNAKVENFDEYDVVILGYPIWWGDMPMAMYTFLESYDFGGKSVLPFNTHEGSGSAGTADKIQKVVPDTEVLEGLTIQGKTAQEDHENTKTAIQEWLSKNNLQ